MSDSYTGWDGKLYPWPPPDGWYEASDGRWWAPGTGPNPPPGAAQQAAADPQAAPQGGSYAADVAKTAQLPAYGEAAPGGQQGPGAGGPPPGGPGAGAAAPGGYSGVQQTADPTAAFQGGHPGAEPPGSTAGWDRPAGAAAPSSGGGGAGRILLMLVGVIAALAVAGAAFLFLRDDGDTTAAGDDEATADGGSTEAGSETAGNEETGADGEAPTDAADGEPTGEDGDGQAPADDDSAADTTTTAPITTEAETTATSDATTTTADLDDQVSLFRSILDDNGLTSDGLSDDDISTFGRTFCIFAIASESQTEYVEFRNQAIAETTSDLTEQELFLVIDAAVVVFCQDEASRLGIDL